MLSLNLPTFAAKVKEKDGKHIIFDPVRRKFVALTPEEWVRQHFVNYLITDKGYPKELLANEVPLKLNGTSKRCDTVAYNRFLTPLMIVEYKAPHIEITSSVFDQIVRYNMVLHVRYLAVSNGISHFCCKIDYKNLTYSFLEGIPEYNVLE
ncbi:type I restriction enzyme HsdR N-terminal domain-containing protein [Parabacteroides faecis]|uniref:type I restriction enzyme HsdR N-terminal domain-containing protein n=1 Tax=Parabacteroides faecis TaxID=1217282 RepID=UPI002164C38D|nr:type I restriction enzyme HsdR N-terminal domain-containing protein [Parabacteroides faecis]MCS2893094.1 type I restriction enzyme HsdR N-terminal domain-containing protein [Parabacteroides faecis]UVQ48298.1 type I restriction enzyme HsdR N-terminal domain-containing protein [Parabacteroides faecis]